VRHNLEDDAALSMMNNSALFCREKWSMELNWREIELR
jgi:hypothetical protein